MKGAIEMPSDVLGVLTIQLEDADEGWKLLLAKEMRAAGLAVDASRILD
jgi:predicted nucleotide-binding protein